MTPPIVNRNTKPIAKSIGVSKVIEPPHMVAIHENTLTPVGTAMIMLAAVKYIRSSTLMPVVNMWCAQTTKPISAIATIA